MKRKRLVRRLTKALNIGEPRREGDGFTVRVEVNGEDYPIHLARAVITIEHGHNDVIEPEGFKTFIRKGSIVTVVEDALPWSMTIDGKYQATRNILPDESSSLSIFRLDNKLTFRSIELQESEAKKNKPDYYLTLPNPENYELLVVGSEVGFNVGDETARVALARKDYKFWITILSEDTRAKAWEFLYSNQPQPTVRKIGPIDIGELRMIQDRLRYALNQQLDAKAPIL
ncbi:MAG: hypothetical protein Q8922_01290 [Bacteroidota bacterium]|nr:hypothetical protein [Bacteroidota bacterium]MDP4232138.1 hypothetical protein [Bacteroidota bacterium]MDP4241154.1 hypothetical protein [Bacteroidota bacterium]MDP4286546.1 hypothetical protein [Bacteroidota bacterium]